jgi:hypothetical protein
VVARDLSSLDALIASGTAELQAVDERTGRLTAALAAVPGIGPEQDLAISLDTGRRYEALLGTKGLTAGLEADWTAFTGRALDAVTLSGLLTDHDLQAAEAAKEGSAAHYKQALKLLDAPDATIARARALGDRLASTTDVSTLVTWLDRNAEYDGALRTLYQSLLDARGRVTDPVRKALLAEKKARARLPGDTRGLVVIMADVAQGGLNQAVIAIEDCRGSLAAALDVQTQLKAGSVPSG